MLEELLENKSYPMSSGFGSVGLLPALIPVSSINGDIQLSASRMSLEQFAGFDRDLIEKLGRSASVEQAVGRRNYQRSVRHCH
jgi:hypothetical protein